jgi:hypothetical protein
MHVDPLTDCIPSIHVRNSRGYLSKQLQRTVIPNRWRDASAPFHYALAPRITRQRAAAELRRWAA